MATEATEELYRVRDTYFPSNPANKASNVEIVQTRSAVESARKQFNVGAGSSNGSVGGSRLEGMKAVASIQSEFNRRASKIGLGIHQNSKKLIRLVKCEFRT